MTHPPDRVVVETAARLHFGLLDTAPPFGGLGVMVDAPKTVVQLSRADEFRVDPRYRSRAERIAKRVSDVARRRSLPPVAIDVLESAPAHCGFGSGTQLSLAIAEGLCRMLGLDVEKDFLAVELADRGKRSAVGVHGYFHGGLIYETGESAGGALNPIRRRIELPEPWRLVLVWPTEKIVQVYGDDEREQFAALTSDRNATGELRRIAETEVVPAADGADFAAFARSIAKYNRQSGMLFARVQGGAYNGPVVSNLIEATRDHGAVGIGQSSWGPGVFAWCEDLPSAVALAESLANDSVRTLVAAPKNQGRNIRSIEESPT